MRICQGIATTEWLFNHTITRQLTSKTRVLSSGTLGALQLVRIITGDSLGKIEQRFEILVNA